MIIFMLQILYIIAIDNLLLLFKGNMHAFQFKIIIPPTESSLKRKSFLSIY